jgi:riboflavin biosynthesis pyrimidine reductase
VEPLIARPPRPLTKLDDEIGARQLIAPQQRQHAHTTLIMPQARDAAAAARLWDVSVVDQTHAVAAVVLCSIYDAWDAEEHAFAAAWRNQPKWVVSRSLKSVGPNARLVEGDLEGAIRELKATRDGEIEVAGPDLAQSLTELGLIDEYRIYLHPVVLGHGKPYFAGPRPPLRLLANDRIGEDVIRLTYVPA